VRAARNPDGRAHRNALNGYCYWTLRDEGMTARAAHARLAGLSAAAKNELLFGHGTNFNDLPAWQWRGAAVLWETYEKQAQNPKTGELVPAQRRRLRRELDLPLWEDYSRLIREILASATAT
jgi:tRNA(His) guanylyltransferase